MRELCVRELLCERTSKLCVRVSRVCERVVVRKLCVSCCV